MPSSFWRLASTSAGGAQLLLAALASEGLLLLLLLLHWLQGPWGTRLQVWIKASREYSTLCELRSLSGIPLLCSLLPHRYGAYRRTLETTAEATAWEQAKQAVG